MRKPEEILQVLLKQRGIEGEEKIKEFLSARPQTAHDPFLLHNMEAGVDLILSEIEAGSRITIYGDYDADGVTSVCILFSFLSHLTDNLNYFIPSRFTDGYGLNKDAIKRIKDDGADMIITVDCGSVSYDEVEYAKSLGLKIVVTDHHTIDKVKADCIVINPKQKECNYPWQDLAGCGVAFKLAQALRMKTNLPREILNDCLDLVAIGTVADIVPLVDENRTMVKYGLLKINSGSRMSIQKLKEGISLKKVTSESIAFGIGPHINAVGRVASADEAVKLFLADNPITAQRQTMLLKESNQKRKNLQNKSYEDCKGMIGDDDDFIVIRRDDIHEGIGGIVAGKIKEEYNRPCVIITPTEDGRLKGTGRSIESINLHEFLNEFNYVFDTFGGHKGACGFSLQIDKYDELVSLIKNKIETIKSENPDVFNVYRDYDMVIEPGEATLKLAEQLECMEPFGQANPRPKFNIENIMLTNPRFMGEARNHVRFTAFSPEFGSLNCILFGKAQDYAHLIGIDEPVSIIGTIDINEFNGSRTVQFRVEEII
ncbi:MAG: single-stranded-DNA-specific exonuclease RecJ [Eubacterium sp.]|nr:single-stranded-DNA-specific exonuclease RecJ [Candidatus Colimonas fimequi]